MPRLTWAALLLACAACSANACTCMAIAPEDEAGWRRNEWAAAQAVVLAEVVGQSSEPVTRWLSREHVLGQGSPLRRRPLLQLVVKHRWKGDLAEGASFVAEKVDGSVCGYEGWGRAHFHLLYLSKRRHWQAGLCGPSSPVVDAAGAVQALDAELAAPIGADMPAPSRPGSAGLRNH